MPNRIEAILQFWFGTFPTPYAADETKSDMWFKNGAAYDNEIIRRFGVDYDKAIKGELNHWADSESDTGSEAVSKAWRGRLALIILLDQFSRHIHRGTANAFAQDAKAQALCIEGISAGDDRKCHAIERSFFYLPLEHAENIEKQTLSVQAYQQLAQDVPVDYRKAFEMTLSYAKSHHYVIEQFGRFPELNKIMGRESTPQEQAFIKSGKYSFL